MFALCYIFSSCCLRNVSTQALKQLSGKRYSNVIALLCTSETERVHQLTFAFSNSIIETLEESVKYVQS